MRFVRTRPPSFPTVAADSPLSVAQGVEWQVLCGDADHWRAGVYSPARTTAAEVSELERHDCPELFLLLWGRLTLVCFRDGCVEELELEPFRPVLISAPHAGFCPDGPHTGRAFVVERDSFATEYREPNTWLES